MEIFIIAVLWCFAFTLGSVPTAYFIVKGVNGRDLRTIGSGNIGATNAKRAGNHKRQGSQFFWTISVLDAVKGFLPVFTAFLLTKNFNYPFRDIICIVSVLLVIIGHDTMPFLKGGSGKGVSTTVGAFLILAVYPVLIGVGTFFFLRIFTKVVSRRSLLSGAAILISCIAYKVSLPVTIGAAVAISLMVLRHSDNIKRMIKGIE